MNYWWIAILLLLMIQLGGVLGKHGEPRKGNYSFGHSLFGIGVMVFLIFKAIQTGF